MAARSGTGRCSWSAAARSWAAALVAAGLAATNFWAAGLAATNFRATGLAATALAATILDLAAA